MIMIERYRVQYNPVEYDRIEQSVCQAIVQNTIIRKLVFQLVFAHYNDVRMSLLASQITSLTIIYSTVYSRRRTKKTSKLRVTGLCVGNSPVTGEFAAQRASNAENVSIGWRHHELCKMWRGRYDEPLSFFNVP